MTRLLADGPGLSLPRVDRLGLVLALAGLAAYGWLPFLVEKANRIVPGDPLALPDALPARAALAVSLTLSLAAGILAFGRHAGVRLAAACAALAALLWALGAAADGLTPAGNRVLRIAPGAGSWVLLGVLGLGVADALARLRPGPLLRVAALVAVWAAFALALAHGTFDHLSILREYAVNAARFSAALRTHVLLALGSLGAALVVALPLGALCHGAPRLREAVFGVLNLVQTIPAIALFGILMAPLAALAQHVPLAARLGVQGIGAAPAVIALFLYSLLPVVANTVLGLGRAGAATVEAARGMGLTRWQVLTRVEIVLALPVILTGIRIVLVQNIGLVTLAALIGGGGLGGFVFQGIGQTAIDLVLLGAIPIVALALTSAVLLDALTETLQGAPP
jgi:osmoprotectant transport system permease protein